MELSKLPGSALGQDELGQGFTPQWISVRCSENMVQRADDLGIKQLSGVVSRYNRDAKR
jgi:hypothetical protein